MLLRRRPPRIDTRQVDPKKGFEHLEESSIAVLRWLRANGVEFVLVGAVAEAVRGDHGSRGPVAIVPAPFRRNFERLVRALESAGARVRVDGVGVDGAADTAPVRITADKLARGQRWTLRCGSHDLDIEGEVPGASRYQELLYEANRFEPAAEVTVEVASPEDIEHYAHVGRTGTAPEILITRQSRVAQDTA